MLDGQAHHARDHQGGFSLSSNSETTQFAGIPGLRGTEHVGFTVPDLEQATEFFVQIIGCEYMFEVGPFASDDDWMKTHLNVHPRTVMRRLRFFRCKHRLELRSVPVRVARSESSDSQEQRYRRASSCFLCGRLRYRASVAKGGCSGSRQSKQCGQLDRMRDRRGSTFCLHGGCSLS